MSVLTNDKLSRRERERLMRRREIMEAAQAVFAEKGYRNATLDEVAQRAEYGKGTLYNYFEGGKEDILFAIFDEIYDDFGAFIASSFTPQKTAGRSFRDTFHDFVESSIRYFFKHQALFMLLVKEAYRMVFSEDPEKATYFKRQRARMVDALVPALEDAMARGELKVMPAQAVAHMILGNINGLQMQISLEGGKSLCDGEELESVLQSSQEAADFLTTMLCDGLLAQPAS